MELITPFLFSAILAFLLVPLTIKFAQKTGLMTSAKNRAHPAHTHTGVVPRAGGLPILISILICTFLFVPIEKTLIGVLIGACATVVIGLFDDKYDISAYTRFVFNIITALVIVGYGVGIPFLTNPFGGVIRLDTVRIEFDLFGNRSILPFADFFAVILIVWMMNAIGWSAGVDGQMPGFVSICAITLGILSYRFSAHTIAPLSVAYFAFITAGAYAGFLPWNFYPQKIMPGYGGKSLGGLLLAVLAILAGGKLGAAVMILGVPLIDAFYIVLRRIMHGKSPFYADDQHLHHLLLKAGWGKRRISLFYSLISLLLAGIALVSSPKQIWYVILMMFVLMGMLVLHLTYKKNQSAL